MIHFFIASLLLLNLSNSKVAWQSPTELDLGKIPQHQAQELEFRFQNISTAPLVIDNVRTSCGCTVADWDSTPIAPGSTGVIKVEYDARDLGYFYKKVKVFFHGQRKAEILAIEGETI